MSSVCIRLNLVVTLSLFFVSLASAEVEKAVCPSALLADLNKRYLHVHRGKEQAYWRFTMGLPSGNGDQLAEADKNLVNWRSDSSQLPAIQTALEQEIDDPRVRAGLTQWKRFFEVHSFADSKLRDVAAEMLAAEMKLAKAKKDLKLTQLDAKGNEVAATTTQLREVVNVNKEPLQREWAFNQFEKLEAQVLASTYPEIIKHRRKFGRLAKAPTYYDYRTQAMEQLSEDEVFAVLDKLEQATREPAMAWRKSMAAKHGEEGLLPWNLGFHARGDMEERMDPYFPISDSIRRWGMTFAGMGVDYRGGTFHIDLLDRQTKTQNGFIRAIQPAFFDLTTEAFRPVSAVFTSNAVLGQVGAGKSALKTLLHEGGHGVHFANIMTPSVAGSQEEAPTSVAGAETHSMFMDQVMGNPIWLKRYAKLKDGTPLSDDFIEEIVLQGHQQLAYTLRSMMVVPYFERELYSMPEEDLTAEKILEVARAVETKLLGGRASFPVLCVFHTHAMEASAYYHGYVMATLAVAQTAAYLEEKLGYIIDNPKVGPLLTEHYYKPGNSVGFSQMVQNLTGKPFSADAMIKKLGRTEDQVKQRVRAQLKQEGQIPQFNGPIDLNVKVFVDDGIEVITSTDPNKTFKEMAQEFSDEVERRLKKKP